MTQPWDFLITFFGGAAVAIAVVAWLSKKLVSQLLEKELAAHKSKLRHASEVELEQLRKLANIAGIEHEIMLSHLQARRAKVIGILYGKLVDAKEKTSVYIMNTSNNPLEEAKKRQQDAHSASRAAVQYFSRNKVWLPKDCCDKVEAFTDDLHKLQVDRFFFAYERQGSENFEQTKIERHIEAWHAVEEKLPAALEALAEELRRLLDPRPSAKSEGA